MNVNWLSRVSLLLLLLGSVARADTVAVTVTGLEAVALKEARQNVQAAIPLSRHQSDAELRPSIIREDHAGAAAAIARALQPFGFYAPVISAELERPAGRDKLWQARYRVESGPALPVAELSLVFEGPGESDTDLAQLADSLPLQQGAVLDHRAYERSKRDLLASLQRLGYTDASLIAHRVEVDLEAYEARALLQVATGPRYVVGEIRFDDTRFDREFLERYLILAPGDAYNSARLAEQRRLYSGAGYFREVVIEPQDPVDNAVPLVVSLDPLLPNRYRGRLGWGTDTGVGAQLDWTRRYLGGRGQNFNFRTGLVQERRRLAGDLNYQIPLDPLEGTRIVVGARHESKDLTFEDVELDEGGETRIATNLLTSLWQRPTHTLGDFTLDSLVELNLVNETYDVFEVLFGNLGSGAQQSIIDSIGPEAYDTLAPDFQAVVPGLRFKLRRSDDTLYIRDGDYFDLYLLGTDEALGSNISFWQARFSSWQIRSFGDHNRVLLRTALGYSDAESSEVLGVDFNAMPEYYEFRAGGVRSVRGYGFETLFPEDAITGGKHQLVGSVEYEYEFMPNFSAAVFVDAGNTFNRWEDYQAKVGTGFGVRWRSPVGLARLDLGFPLDDAEDAFQIYITVGPEF
ncbi:BamA/TamA family outer membrane protein [Parahaliea maris]|uniref:Translocation and assembly module subunit TamA n=1 Tax=Parahaliea maris TaxID=2716870 RepID=A0A5C8ZQL8_9GAMM|nr:BamA/TamA family outer membrane protein [Parahaliea maris]TXS90738.1 BamA/TamA family outer membrane protein [Parahaliea maris]